MTGPVHHDYRGHVALLALWNLELYVHLTDGYLIRNRRWIGSGTSCHRGLVSDFWHAANEEATLVFDHQRLGQEFLDLWSFFRSCNARRRQNQDRGTETPN